MASQRKLLNELQVLNEFTQADVTKASRDLGKVVGDREAILLQINEEEQATVKIKSRHQGLEVQITSMNPKQGQKDENKDSGTDTTKKQELDSKPQEKIRSKHAFFQF